MFLCLSIHKNSKNYIGQETISEIILYLLKLSMYNNKLFELKYCLYTKMWIIIISSMYGYLLFIYVFFFFLTGCSYSCDNADLSSNGFWPLQTP